MNAKRLVTLALVAMLATAGVAAAAGPTQHDATTRANSNADVAVTVTVDDGTATLTVTRDGSPVTGVDVYVDGTPVGTTDAAGTVSFDATVDDPVRVQLRADGQVATFTYPVGVDDVAPKRLTERLELTERVALDAEATNRSQEQTREQTSTQTREQTREQTHERTTAQRQEQPHDREQQGPPTDLPERVPDHVSGIHDLVRSFLGGDLDARLGASISDFVGGGHASGAGAAANADAHAGA